MAMMMVFQGNDKDAVQMNLRKVSVEKCKSNVLQEAVIALCSYYMEDCNHDLNLHFM